jgi:hypothetical protein
MESPVSTLIQRALVAAALAGTAWHAAAASGGAGLKLGHAHIA